jgi:hypothetical protein
MEFLWARRKFQLEWGTQKKANRVAASEDPDILATVKKNGRRRLPVWASPWFIIECWTVKQSLKICTLLESRMHEHVPAEEDPSSHKRKNTANHSGIWIFYGSFRPSNGLSITHHHPMRNAVRAEIPELSSFRHQMNSFIYTISVWAYTELYPNGKRRFTVSTG